MDYLIPTNDPRMLFAFWLGVCVVVASLVMLIAILVIRQWVERSERIHRNAAERWRAILVDAAHGRDVPAPKLARSEVSGFIDVWNELHDAPNMTADAHAGVVRIAEQVGLEDRLHHLVDHGTFHNRVMAIVASGHLRSPRLFDKLAKLLGDNSPIVSISAARAMMKVDPAHAVQLVVPKIVDRKDWVDGGVAQVLHEAGAKLVAPELSSATLQVNDDVASRLVRFLAGIDPGAASPVIRKILDEAHDEHLVSTCLQVMTDGSDLAVVRPLLQHPRWHVRMHAAAAMGKFGGRDDVAGLQPLLADAQWWVRYRSAQAIQNLIGNRAEVERVRDGQGDRFARDILDHVIAEQAMGVSR